MENPEVQNTSEPNGKGRMWNLDKRLDQPLGEEAGHVRAMQFPKEESVSTTLWLSFMTLGVVYGELGTSPLYVFPSIFPDPVTNKDDILAALSLIIYTITLIPLVKYVFITLRANDNGEGGTFALYSLVCRHAKINTIPSQHPTDKQLTTYFREPMAENSRASKIKRKLERSVFLQKALLILVLIGTSMIIGDGILTPAISVLSSVKGIEVKHPDLPHGVLILIASMILVGLFSMQSFGTGKLGFIFAPIILIWFLSIGFIGLYNIIKYEPSIFRAFSPVYAYHFFSKNARSGWNSLGGVVLSITGVEAMFADLGHFSAFSIQLAFTVVVFPCLLLAYMGQAAYLRVHLDQIKDGFYNSIPGPVFWPMFVIATVAAIIASQATISATFSIVKQSVALGCFPRVKVIHTSRDFLGQIYIPEINWLLMVLCVLVTAGFGETAQIGNAYGIAVVAVMLETTLLMTFIMLFIWQSHLIPVLLFLIVIGSIESVYFSSVLFKVTSGGWVPLAFAVLFSLIMYIWHYGSVKRYEFEMQNKVPIGWIMGLGPSLGLVRVPGIGLVYTHLAHGVPSLFSHFLTHLPAIHSILVFVCVKYLPVSTVPEEERFLIRRIGDNDFWMFRCAVRYGYTDLHKKDDCFEDLLIQSLTKFIQVESFLERLSQIDDDFSPGIVVVGSNQSTVSDVAGMRIRHQLASEITSANTVSFISTQSVSNEDTSTEDQLKFLQTTREAGVVHILGNTLVQARKGSSLWQRIAINYGYMFLRRISRDTSVIYHIPHESLLNVGMVYYV